jgi:hypothetical protein
VAGRPPHAGRRLLGLLACSYVFRTGGGMQPRWLFLWRVGLLSRADRRAPAGAPVACRLVLHRRGPAAPLAYSYRSVVTLSMSSVIARATGGLEGPVMARGLVLLVDRNTCFGGWWSE